MLDMTDSIAPRSDQMNADDLIAGPRTFTITEARRSSSDEQPFDFHLAEFPGRPYKPSKSMRRVMVIAWGKDASLYVGRRLTLYREPSVRWAGQEIGGIRISHMSHLSQPLKIALTESSSKRTPYTVQPLKDEAPAPKPADDPLKALADAMTRTLELATREDKLAYLSGALGREIASAKDVTPAEATRLLQEIASEQQAPSAVAAESTVSSGDADGWPAVATIPGTEADQ